MPHKLLVEFDLVYQSEFSTYLKPLEVVRGDSFKLRLFVTNLGTLEFPGIEAAELTIDFRPYGVTQSRWRPDSLLSCPAIAPADKVKIYEDDSNAIDEGTAWIRLKMTPKDKQPIEYYQILTAPLGTELWENHLYVVDRHTMRIIALLDGLTARLQ